MKYTEECLKILANSQVQVMAADFLPIIQEINSHTEYTPAQYQMALVTRFTEAIRATVQALNFPLLRTITFSLIQKELQYPLSFTEDSSNEELHQQVSQISVYLNQINAVKAEFSHYLSLLQHAADALESFIKPITSIFEMESLLNDANFSAGKAKKALLSLILNTVETPLTQVKQYIKDLNNYLENVVSPQNNTLLRVESSIRLILTSRERQSSFTGYYSTQGTSL